MDHIEKGQFQDNMSSRAENPKDLIRNDPWFSHMFKHRNAIDDIKTITLKGQTMGIGNDMEVLFGGGDIKIDRFHFFRKVMVKLADSRTEIQDPLSGPVLVCPVKQLQIPWSRKLRFRKPCDTILLMIFFNPSDIIGLQ